jgi:phosphoglycerol transferase MdoB-like AlkP superfamily enzyme
MEGASTRDDARPRSGAVEVTLLPANTHPTVPLLRTLPLLPTMLTLVTFAFSQSLYEMLAGNPELLALRLESNEQLLEIILVFNLLPAVVLFAAGWLLFHIHPAAGRIFVALVCFLLFLMFFSELDNTYFLRYWRGFSHSYWLGVFPALGLSAFFLRFEKAAYSFVRVLSPIVLVFPAIFLARTWSDTSTYVPAPILSAQAGVSADTARKLPPIVILVLDELSLPAIVDDAGRIDAARYPNFHSLAQQSYWFRNATANADHTVRSVPAFLTGNLPLTRGSPTFRVYPENLFNLLQPHYEIYVWETWTRFCVARVYHCMGSLHEHTANRADLFRDILFLYGERVLPGGVSVGFPADTRTWALQHDPHRLSPLRLAHFEEFMKTLSSVTPRGPFLLYFHHDLPHSPYWLSSEGVSDESGPAEFNPNMRGDARTLARTLERYRQQIMFVDMQLGRSFEILKARSLFDACLIIVYSDHGVSYREEAPGRNMVEQGGRVANADLLLSVPLLIKLPRQQRGEISDQDVQLIDVLPTVAELLELAVPWQTEGRSVFADSLPARPKVAFDRTGRRYEFSADLGLRALEYGRESSAATANAAAPRP